MLLLDGGHRSLVGRRQLGQRIRAAKPHGSPGPTLQISCRTGLGRSPCHESRRATGREAHIRRVADHSLPYSLSFWKASASNARSGLSLNSIFNGNESSTA